MQNLQKTICKRMEKKPLKLSIIVPGIRPQNWQKLYCSVDFSESWEIIFIGPYPPPFHLSADIKYAESFRSPNACQQMGLIVSQGEFITFAADDGVFIPGALDKALSMAEYKKIVVGKYIEGDNPNPDMLKEDYYRFKYHKTYRLKGVPQNALIFNCGIISRKFMLELGGWDSAFEATTCAHADLGIRASRAGAEMILMDGPMFKCTHQPGKTGDHGPVHNAMKRDIKTFQKMYAQPNDRITIPLDNWKSTPEKWSPRFGK